MLDFHWLGLAAICQSACHNDVYAVITGNERGQMDMLTYS